MKKYRRVLLKLSGEFLMGDLDFGVDIKTADRAASEIAAARNDGHEICIVVGGGNIFRGMSAASYGMHRAAADSIGMLATVMNAITLQNSLERLKIPTQVMSAIAMPTICRQYTRRKALQHLEQKHIVICAAGIGNPYFTTDTAATLRASELECDVLIKATKVDGIYNMDPEKNPDAEFIKNISYEDIIAKNIRVMDQTAITLARDNSIPVVVFSIKTPGNFEKVLSGEGCCSIIG